MKNRFTPKKEAVVLERDPADIIAEKQHSKIIPVQEEEGSEGGLENKHRVSLNLPKDKYEIVRKRAKAKGLTLTAYIIILINQDIEIA